MRKRVFSVASSGHSQIHKRKVASESKQIFWWGDNCDSHITMLTLCTSCKELLRTENRWINLFHYSNILILNMYGAHLLYSL